MAGVAIPVDRLPRTARTRGRAPGRGATPDAPAGRRPGDASPRPALTPVPVPDLGDEGPHLSYAVQWFLFATIAAVGLPAPAPPPGAGS